MKIIFSDKQFRMSELKCSEHSEIYKEKKKSSIFDRCFQ